MLEDRLDYFILAYESKNFSTAAAQIPMSPQGFTKAIHNLERQLGVTLFNIDSNGMRQPTVYADRFYEYAKDAKKQREYLQRSFDSIATGGAAKLQIASSLGVVGLIGAQLKECFQRRCPEVELTIIEMPDEDCERAITEGRYSCGLLVTPARGDLEFTEIFKTHVCLWVHRSNELFNHDMIYLSDLKSQTVAMPGHGFHCYQRLVDRIEDQGLAMPEVIERSEIIWIYEETARARALGFSLPYMQKLAAFSHVDDIRAIPVEGSRWGFGVVFAKTPAENSYEDVFRQCVLDCSQSIGVLR